MSVAGIDVGTGGVRVVLLDDDGDLVSRSGMRLATGRRTEDGGHLLDDGAIMRTALAALAQACGGDHRPEAVLVSSTSGTLCLRNLHGEPAAEAIAYDDGRHGGRLARVAAWHRLVHASVRVVPPGDALLEALGAEPGGTDWTSALKLGWDPMAESWPDEATDLPPGFLPTPVMPGRPCGRMPSGSVAPDALLVRGVTDGCAMQLASGPPRPGDWSISLGTTVAWKTAALGGPPTLPAGAYAHRLAESLWLPGAASNTGGGVLTALQPGADLRAKDQEAVLPSQTAAYPLARPGERFPVNDPGFAGFGLPPPDHPAFHAAILEGTGYVIRYGIERLLGRGIPDWDTFRVSGGGARSPTWMTVIASVLRRTVVSAPEIDAALGAALIALAALRGEPAGSVAAAAGAMGPVREHVVDQGLRPWYSGGYSTFLGILSRR
ncbi:MAG: FGGY-family carbohydrate kinase [Candidatus Dormibacteria bacterium]